MDQKLLKLLEMTTSDQDNEALSAIRKANDFLRRNELRWVDVIKRFGIRFDDKLDEEIIALSEGLYHLSDDDKRLVAKVKQRFLNNQIDDSDIRTINYLKKIIEKSSRFDDELGI